MGRTEGPTLYEQDFHAWAMQQAALLRTGDLAQADILNIAEEIESMGRTEKRELVNRLKVLLLHLLKWQIQSERRGTSGRNTIRTQRLDVADHLEDNPSLTAQTGQALVRAYDRARLAAVTETGLAEATFPALCPWSIAEVLDAGFWPNGE